MSKEKKDDGKLRYDLMPYDALEEVARVYTFGAQKYEERCWERGIRVSRWFAAALRHMFAWWRGQTADEESGIHHLAHAAWNILAILAYYKRYMQEFDDRPGTKGDQQWNPK